MKFSRILGSRLALLACFALIPASAVAGGQRVGSWESAIDVPWRITPGEDGGFPNRIPINISIMDANYWRYTDDCDLTDYEISDCDNPSPSRIKSIVITEMDELGNILGSRSYDDDADVFSIEKTTGYWKLGMGLTGSTGNPGTAGSQFLCLNEGPAATRCDTSYGDRFTGIDETSEYHIVLAYEPFRKEAGTVILQVDVAYLASDGRSRKMRSKLTTNLAYAALPKFDGGYAYGDLHYHSQGTDNTGEYGYSYREAYHAANTIGLDWVVASDHANNTEQVNFLEAEVNLGTLWGAITSDLSALADDSDFDGLSDMNHERWMNHWNLINGDNGNHYTGFTGLLKTQEAGHTALMQRTGGSTFGFRVPNLVLGGEVDYIPEVPMNGTEAELLTGTVDPYTYEIWKICLEYPTGSAPANLATNMAVDTHDDLNWHTALTETGEIINPADYPRFTDISKVICRPRLQSWEDFGDGWAGIKDVQGNDGMDFSRQHLIHIPRDITDMSAGIISDTNRSGGASRRLSEIHETEYVEGQKGYGFLAHPLASSGGRGVGRLGPDMMPLHPAQIQRAMEMEYILGLQAWNENEKFESVFTESLYTEPYSCNTTPMGNTVEMAYLREVSAHDRWHVDSDAYWEYLNSPESDDALCQRPLAEHVFDVLYDSIPGKGDSNPGAYFSEKESHWISIAGGFLLTDMVNLWGLEADRVKNMAFLAEDEPRKMFIAGGSDAHGDLSQRRVGYTLGIDSITDTALGTPRNLVMTGEPDGDVVQSGYGAGQAYSWNQVLNGLTSGNFSVTDGPAVRIAIDNNANGVIDSADTPMGSTLTLSALQQLDNKVLDILVEYKSTPDFGTVDHVYLFIGGMAVGLDRPVHFGPASGVDFENELLPAGETRWGTGEWQLKEDRKVKGYDDNGNLVDMYNYRENKVGDRDPMRTYISYQEPLKKSYGWFGSYAGTARFRIDVSHFAMFDTEWVIDEGTSFQVVKNRYPLNRMFFRAEVDTRPPCLGSVNRTCSKPYVGVTNPVWVVERGWKNAQPLPPPKVELQLTQSRRAARGRPSWSR